MKNKQPSLFCTLILCFFSTVLLAQDDFKSGTLTTLEGEVLQGEIAYKKWKKTPESILFKSSFSGETKRYTALMIKGFVVNNERYESHNITVDKSPHIPSKVQQAEPDKDYVINDRVFLQALVIGQASLYYFTDENDKPHFYLFQEKLKEELILAKEFKKISRNASGVVAINKFRNQLTYHFIDCPKVKKKIDRTAYKLYSMIVLFEAYNDCVSSEVSYVKEVEKTKFSFGPIIGGESRSATFVKADRFAVIEVFTDLNKSRQPFFGFFGEFVMPTKKQNLTLYFDAIYALVKFENNSGDLFFKYKQFKMTAMGRYYFRLGKKIDVYLNGGIMGGRNLNLENSEFTITKFNEFSHAYIGGAGVSVGKFNVEFRYEDQVRSNSITNSLYQIRDISALQVMLSYRIQ